MRLLLLAYPGAGKSTQAAKLATHYGVALISSGARLRDGVAHGTKTGRIAAQYLERGDLVPDEVVVELMWTRILEAACLGGYVLDGFPRTLRQATEAYSRARNAEGVTLEAVVHLRVGMEELRNRLQARADREGRSDDNDGALSRRFEVFDVQTRPLLEFYAARGLLVDVNAEKPAEDVFVDITHAIDGLHA